MARRERKVAGRMPVLGQDAGGETGREPVDRRDHRRPVRDFERPSGAEIVLDVDDHEGRAFKALRRQSPSPPLLLVPFLSSPPPPRAARTVIPSAGGGGRTPRFGGERRGTARHGAAPVRSSLFDLDEGSAEVLRMEEEHRLAVRPDARLAAPEHAGARRHQAIARRAHVVHFVADVMGANRPGGGRGSGRWASPPRAAPAARSSCWGVPRIRWSPRDRAARPVRSPPRPGRRGRRRPPVRGRAPPTPRGRAGRSRPDPPYLPTFRPRGPRPSRERR